MVKVFEDLGFFLNIFRYFNQRRTMNIIYRNIGRFVLRRLKYFSKLLVNGRF